MGIKSTKHETSDFISFRCFYEHKKCCLFCLLVCVFMLFMLVKFSRKKKKKSKIGPNNLHYHTTSGYYLFILFCDTKILEAIHFETDDHFTNDCYFSQNTPAPL